MSRCFVRDNGLSLFCHDNLIPQQCRPLLHRYRLLRYRLHRYRLHRYLLDRKESLDHPLQVPFLPANQAKFNWLKALDIV